MSTVEEIIPLFPGCCYGLTAVIFAKLGSLQFRHIEKTDVVVCGGCGISYSHSSFFRDHKVVTCLCKLPGWEGLSTIVALHPIDVPAASRARVKTSIILQREKDAEDLKQKREAENLAVEERRVARAAAAALAAAQAGDDNSSEGGDTDNEDEDGDENSVNVEGGAATVGASRGSKSSLDMSERVHKDGKAKPPPLMSTTDAAAKGIEADELMAINMKRGSAIKRWLKKCQPSLLPSNPNRARTALKTADFSVSSIRKDVASNTAGQL